MAHSLLNVRIGIMALGKHVICLCEQFLQACLAMWSLGSEVLKVGSWFLARQVVEVRRATCVKAIAQVCPEECADRTKVLLPLHRVEGTVLDLLAHGSRQVRPC